MPVTQNGKGSYILAVDDIPDNLFLIQLALEQEGHKVVLVDNGRAALQQIKQSPPSLILLDVMMPEMDGYEVTRRIREDRHLPFIPILLITAHEESSLIQGLDAGADEFLRKPVQIDELQARVRSMLRLKQTMEQRENFVSCLTHDLRTPLVAANRMLTLMQQKAFGDISSEMEEAIANIISSNNNLLQMLNTLLEAHHYEVGQKILSFIPFDLQQLIQEVITEVKPLAIEKGIELKQVFSAEVTTIKGDRLEIRRVLTNLIGNAIKFTDTGYVKVILSQNQEQVFLKIEDTGIGISPQERQNIFERYHQGNHRRSGKGLGLYLCQQIVSAHQGKISVQSELGKGTTFTVCFSQSIQSEDKVDTKNKN
jgi:signal transduction histidine kinase